MKGWPGALLAVALLLEPARAAEVPPALEPARRAVQQGDLATAKKLLLTEAEKGSAEAANALGELLLGQRDAKGVVYAEAARWFQKAVDAGLAAGMANLAGLLREGVEGVPQDVEKARFLTRAAAEAGCAPAQLALARELEATLNLQGRTPDWRAPREWLEKASAQGHPDALFAMIRYFDEGLAGTRDPLKGTDYCLRAAKVGSVVAMNEMGLRYQRGRGINMDNVAAIGWFSLAAQNHLPEAHVNLGQCYETGEGSLTDFNRAGENYAAAAKLGHPRGQLLLGQLFESGKAGGAKPVFAYVNYVRAAAQNLPEGIKRRDALKAKLTSEQLREAGQILQSPGEK